MPSIGEEPSVLEEAFFEIADSLRVFSTNGVYIVGVVVAFVGIGVLLVLNIGLLAYYCVAKTQKAPAAGEGLARGAGVARELRKHQH